MTSYRYKRCVHCNRVYEWQSSGEGCQRQENDGEYCPECKLVLIEALKKVPKLFDSVWVETDEVSAQVLLDHREAKLEKQ